jgi:hypothetical protein
MARCNSAARRNPIQHVATQHNTLQARPDATRRVATPRVAGLHDTRSAAHASVPRGIPCGVVGNAYTPAQVGILAQLERRGAEQPLELRAARLCHMGYDRHHAVWDTVGHNGCDGAPWNVAAYAYGIPCRPRQQANKRRLDRVVWDTMSNAALNISKPVDLCWYDCVGTTRWGQWAIGASAFAVKSFRAMPTHARTGST